MGGAPVRYCLGLDIGATSLGWALVGLDDEDRPDRVLRMGTHLFDAGVQGAIEQGRDESRAVTRRSARTQRRQIRRRAGRLRKALRVLQSLELLPEFDSSSPEAIHAAFLALDTKLRLDRPAMSPGEEHTLPYRLRAEALDRRLEPHALGRALYHLAQRRGFKSNRNDRVKARTDGPDSDEDVGAVKSGIRSLEGEMREAGSRTLGEHFSKLDPEQHRIRRRWTARSMFEAEFDQIVEAQRPFHAQALAPDHVKRLRRVLYFQRPLKSSAGLIGRCELHGAMPYPPRRAPWASRIAQEFRTLQKVNDLRLDAGGRTQPLGPDLRAQLLDHLRRNGDCTFAKAKKVLGLPRTATFSLERGDETRLTGNRVESAFSSIWGDAWWNLSTADRDEIIRQVVGNDSERALTRMATNSWGLSAAQVASLLELRLEGGHAAHCRKCLERLIAGMCEGASYGEVRPKLFPSEPVAEVRRLPPVRKVLKELRSPAVMRALTELRKLVNAILREYGLPAMVRIELARDLRASRLQRKLASRRMRDREKEREHARIQLRDGGVANPSRSDIEKYLLWIECNRICPYTGASISFGSLFGPSPSFDVEHILPLSRTLDDSFVNKTLCEANENRNRKANRTPFEAYDGTAEWEAILGRVGRFKSDVARAKLARFQQIALPEEFVASQLQDTRYTSVLAAEYIGRLFGGRVDDTGTQRVQTTTGGVTAHLRNEWRLHSVLGDGGAKQRSDHRHHAVDALVVALSGPRAVQALAKAATDPRTHRRRTFAPLPPPWEGFAEEVLTQVSRINVSHRASRGLAGPLHADSHYSTVAGRQDANGRPRRARREPLVSLSRGRVDDIVDPRVRELVLEKLESLNKTPDQAFKDPANLPALPTHDGRRIPIRRARVWVQAAFWNVGSGARVRAVVSGSGTNHHACIVETPPSNADSPAQWKDHVVSRFEAHQRWRRGEPIVQRHWPNRERTIFSLMRNDFLVYPNPDGSRNLYRVLSVSQGDIDLVLHCDARPSTERKKERVRTSGSKLQEKRAYKATVSYLGEVVPMND